MNTWPDGTPRSSRNVFNWRLQPEPGQKPKKAQVFKIAKSGRAITISKARMQDAQKK